MDPNPGGPKTRGSGSATLLFNNFMNSYPVYRIRIGQNQDPIPTFFLSAVSGFAWITPKADSAKLQTANTVQVPTF
jgi:hypothetical protein